MASPFPRVQCHGSPLSEPPGIVYFWLARSFQRPPQFLIPEVLRETLLRWAHLTCPSPEPALGLCGKSHKKLYSSHLVTSMPQSNQSSLMEGMVTGDQSP